MSEIPDRDIIVRPAAHTAGNRTAGERSDSSAGCDEISREERDRILEEIDSLFRSRTSAYASRAGDRPRRSGGVLLSLAVNISALLLLGAGILIVTALRSDPGEPSAAAEGFATAEGHIVEAVKDNAAAVLREREARIAEIRRELVDLRRQASGSRPAMSGADGTDAIPALEAELAALLPETERRLAEIDRQSREEKFLLGQLRAAYAAVRSALAAGNAARARVLLADAERLVQETGALMQGGASAGTFQTVNAVLRDALARIDSAEEKEEAFAMFAGRIGELRNELERSNAALRDRERDVEALSGQLAAFGSGLERGARAARALAERRYPADGPDDRQIIDLLESKVVLREVVDSPVVRAEYPDLYDEMDRYFSALGADKKREGREQGFLLAAEALDALLAALGSGSPVSGSLAPTDAPARERYLSRLDALAAAFRRRLP